MFGLSKARWPLVTVLGLALCQAATGAEPERKVVNKVKPAYPELARQMNVAGTVKLEVVIAANGSVKSVKPIGGHPLLIQSASDALRKWRYAPGGKPPRSWNSSSIAATEARTAKEQA